MALIVRRLLFFTGGYAMSKTMLVAVTDGRGNLCVRQATLPSIGPYEALLEMRFGATCAATDQRVIDGGHPRPLQYPGILGHESVGRVIALGEKVTSFHPGDLITRVGAPALGELAPLWGGFAQYGVATDWQAMRRDGFGEDRWRKARVQRVVPPGHRRACRADDDYLARNAQLCHSRWRGGGHGGLGDRFGRQRAGDHRPLRLCRLPRGGHGSAARESLARRAGASAYLDYHAAQLPSRLRELFPRGIDRIFDAVGYARNVNEALPLVRPGACVGVYGRHARSDYGVNPFLAAHTCRLYCDGYDESETHEEVVSRIRSGALDASLYYDCARPVPLEQIAQAYADLRERRAVKYLIDLRVLGADCASAV